jgi:hypothetical protein
MSQIDPANDKAGLVFALLIPVIQVAIAIVSLYFGLEIYK